DDGRDAGVRGVGRSGADVEGAVGAATVGEWASAQLADVREGAAEFCAAARYSGDAVTDRQGELSPPAEREKCGSALRQEFWTCSRPNAYFPSLPAEGMDGHRSLHAH